MAICEGPPWHLGVSGVCCSGLGFFVEGCCCAPPMLPIMTAWMVLGVLGLLGRTLLTTYGICQLRVVCRLGPFGAGGLPTAHWSDCMCHSCPWLNAARHLGLSCYRRGYTKHRSRNRLANRTTAWVPMVRVSCRSTGTLCCGL